jgi:glucuronate isomerase
MKPFIHDDFLLHSAPARELYHRYAEKEPIFDYHCHLSPRLIAENHRFADLAEIWLGGDHYKWRAMRADGVAERLCTGDASPREKFDAWCSTVPRTLRNPLYHWSHLELKRYFGIDALIGPTTADEIWERANARLSTLRVHDILAGNNVAVVCTTDDPASSLADHERIQKMGLKTRVYPAFRPDKAMRVDRSEAYNVWLESLEGAAGHRISSFDDLLAALHKRHGDFHAAGCRLSDHGLDTALSAECTLQEARAAFDSARAGKAVSPAERAKFASFLMPRVRAMGCEARLDEAAPSWRAAGRQHPAAGPPRARYRLRQHRRSAPGSGSRPLSRCAGRHGRAPAHSRLQRQFVG